MGLVFFAPLRFCGILLLGAVILSGCGKRRPPLPPIERVQQRTELLSGAQQGNEVILSWPAPQRNAPDSSVQSIRRIDVYRLAEKPGAPRSEERRVGKSVDRGGRRIIKKQISD